MTLKEIAVQNLKESKYILDALGITFWLDAGTLLGAYRDKDFCQDDEDDIDLCTWDNYRYLRDSIVEEFLKRDFELIYEWDYQLMFLRGGNHIDLFFNQRDKDKAFRYQYEGKNMKGTLIAPAKYYERLKAIRFKGMSFLAPSPIREYLTLKYNDRQTPVHRSKFTKDYLLIKNNEENS